MLTSSPPPSQQMLTLNFSNRNLTETLLNFDQELSQLGEFEPRHLKTLDLSYNNFSSFAFLAHSILAWIESLDISNNNITKLPSHFPPQLRKLDLSHNFLKTSAIGNKIKTSCRFLICLKLNHNALANSLSMVEFPRELASLDISNNGIASFDGALDHLVHLHTLRAQNNEFEIWEDAVDQITRLGKFQQLRYLHLLKGNEEKLFSASAKRNCNNDHDEKHHERVSEQFFQNGDEARMILASVCESLRTLDGIPLKGRESFRASALSNILPLQRQQQESFDEISTSTPNDTSKSSSSSSSSIPVATNNIQSADLYENSNQKRDERRKCQALRQMLQEEMKQESLLKAEVEHLRRQVRQQQHLQKNQLATLSGLRAECKQGELEAEKLRMEIADRSLVFSAHHAETKNRRVLDALSSNKSNSKDAEEKSKKATNAQTSEQVCQHRESPEETPTPEKTQQNVDEEAKEETTFGYGVSLRKPKRML